MRDRLLHGWRVAAALSVLSVFVSGVFVMAFAIGPWIRLTSRSELERARRARRCLSWSCRHSAIWGERLGVWRVRVEGGSLLRGERRIVVANHPTMLDAMVLLPLLDDGVCVTRSKHWDRPVMRRIIAAGVFPFDDTGVDVVTACTKRIEEGASVLLFPEGTRSPAAGLNPLMRGAAHIALRTGCDLSPVVLTCEPPLFAKHTSWMAALSQRVEIRARVQPVIPVDEPLRDRMARPVAARQLTDALREVLEKQLERPRV